MTDLNIVESKSRFSEIVARAAAGEHFVIHRRSLPVAVLISSGEWDRLQRSAELGQRLAQALGQDSDILDAVAAGTAHPIMAAFGLWQEEDDLAGPAADIARNRVGQSGC
jgi:prevent-host-death family protein